MAFFKTALKKLGDQSCLIKTVKSLSEPFLSARADDIDQHFQSPQVFTTYAHIL